VSIHSRISTILVEHDRARSQSASLIRKNAVNHQEHEGHQGRPRFETTRFPQRYSQFFVIDVFFVFEIPPEFFFTL
jgi:hypothetical protein